MDTDIQIPEALDGRVYIKPNLKDYTLDDNELERNCPLDLGRHNVDPQNSLGLLDELPLEIISDILVRLPLRSLMEFRSVNQRAMDVVNSIPQFQLITRSTISPLRGILSVEAGLHITCQDLFRAFTSSTCEGCEDFAGFIYLLDCTRVCFLCFSEKLRYLPLTAAEVLRTYGLSRKFLSDLVQMKSIPGCYSPNEKKCPARLDLIDPESARRAGIALYGSSDAMEQHVARVVYAKADNRRARVDGRAQSTLSTTAIGGTPRLAFAKRFMAVVRAPMVNVPTGSIEWGFHCVGCKRQYRQRPLHWRRKFTPDTFKLHVEYCGPVVNGEHVPP